MNNEQSGNRTFLTRNPEFGTLNFRLIMPFFFIFNFQFSTFN